MRHVSSRSRRGASTSTVFASPKCPQGARTLRTIPGMLAPIPGFAASLALALAAQSPASRPAGASVAASGDAGAAAPVAASADAVVDAGAMKLEVHVSRTANRFHVVDQISEWSRYCHSQYREALGASSPADAAMLGRHRGVREKRGWGGGLEQTFYAPLDLDAAIREGVARGHLTEKEAAAERAVLLHFADRVDALLEKERPRLEAFARRIEGERDALRAFAAKVSRFCGGAAVTVPVYLIANPAERDLGGGYNGDRLTLEIPHAYDAMPTLLHEAMHAFVQTQRDALEAAIARAPSLDFETLNEGIAYALNPGLYHPDPGTDPLAASVALDLAQGAPFESLARYRRFGLALRPLLRETLDDPERTIGDFLPRALDAWRALHEVESARKIHARTWLSAGPGWRPLQEILGARGEPIASFNHSAAHYDERVRRAAPGTSFVMLFALDSTDRAVPDGYADRLPKPWPEIEAALKRGETVELRGRARGLDVIVLAAPTVARLEALVRESKLLSPESPRK